MLDTLAVSFDLPILYWIQANLQSPFMDKFMPFITLFGEGGIFWIAVAVILLILPKTRKTGLGMGFALIFGLVVCNMTLKPLCQRVRPYDFQMENYGITINLLVKALHDYSFPSGHTIASFEAATVLMRRDKRMGIPALILACLIAFSLLYLYVHYPTDVLVAIVLGVIFGILGDMLAEKVAPMLPFPGKSKSGKYLK